MYTHANSPVRKAASTNQLRGGVGDGDEAVRRPGSPLKRVSLPGGGGGLGAERRDRRRDGVEGRGLEKMGGLNQRFSALRERESRPY